MKKIVLGTSFVCLCLLFSCSVQAGVKGNLINFVENDSIMLFNPFASTPTPIETVKVNKKGSFELVYNPEVTGFYYLVLSNQKQILIVLKPNETAQMDIDFVSGMVQAVRNSEENLLLKNFYDLNVKHTQQLSEIQNEQGAHSAQYQSAVNDMTATVRALLSQHSANYASSAVLEYLPMESNMDIYETVLSGLAKAYSKDQFIQTKYTELANAKKTAVGYLAPEITLPDTNGKTLSLSSFRGKVVLIDFWASWCRPCRQENPNMVRMYNKYHAKGFEMLGVSLDKDKQSWIAAIRADGLTWSHVSDLKHWQSAAAAEYGVRSIPHTVLVDKQGNIIAKNLRGFELEQKLEEIFSRQ
jgi:peroxiredoxin